MAQQNMGLEPTDWFNWPVSTQDLRGTIASAMPQFPQYEIRVFLVTTQSCSVDGMVRVTQVLRQARVS